MDPWGWKRVLTFERGNLAVLLLGAPSLKVGGQITRQKVDMASLHLRAEGG